MPGLVPGIHVFLECRKQDVDGRTKSGHDDVGLNARGKRSKTRGVRHGMTAGDRSVPAGTRAAYGSSSVSQYR